MSDSENEVNSGALLVDGAEVFKRNWPLLLVSGVATALAQAGQNLVDHQKLSGIGGVALAALVTLAVTYGISAVVSRGLLLREQIAAEDVPPVLVPISAQEFWSPLEQGSACCCS